jgi:hypothetical protein
MVKNTSKYEINISYISFVSYCYLLLDGSAGRIARELWWMHKEFSPVDIIPPWLYRLIYYHGDEQ